MFVRSNFLLFFVCTVSLVGCNRPRTVQGLSPAESLATFEVADGFQIEQIAAEPLVADPVAMEIDEFGRLYVVEMHGYPLDKGGSGTVKLLEDTDGDGIMDKSTVFAENLVLPTGIMRWKQGVLVSDAPDILYLEDTDGDGKADKREVVLTGFALANPQHNVNNPLLGIDNWIYLGHEPASSPKVYVEEFGDQGSDVFFPSHPDGPRLPKNALGRSVRFNPDRIAVENLSSRTQFGHTFDRWGRRFMVSNAHHIFHEVLGAAYLGRNPSFLISNTVEHISDHGNAADVYPITKNPEHQLLTDVGVFTSACGITAYTGGLFPGVYDSVTFVAEPVSNLIHADVLQDRGATFTASRLFEQKEFLASTDAWFRPVNMYIGPDGALYVLDYYRQIIEHPEWMADDVAKSGAVYNGIDQGRIYRITPKGTAALDWSNRLALGDASVGELVEQLGNSNGWWRRHAQRLLLDRRDQAAVPLLEKQVREAAEPVARLHALWTLHGLGALSADLVVAGLRDAEGGVRENAIRMAESLFLQEVGEETGRVVDELILLKDDRAPRVRFQLLASLGFVNTPATIQARKDLLFAHLDDSWMQIAALSAVPSEGDDLLAEVVKLYRRDDPNYASLTERLSNMVGMSGDVSRISSLIKDALTPSASHKGWSVPVLNGLAHGLKNTGIPVSKLADDREQLLAAWRGHTNVGVKEAIIEVLGVLGLPESEQTAQAVSEAAIRVKDSGQGAALRVDGIRLLTLSGAGKYSDLLLGLITPTEPVPVQSAALDALNTIPDTTISVFLVEKWANLTPGLRSQAVGTFLGSEQRINVLLGALERGDIDRSVISWPTQVGLMNNGNLAIRNRARDILSGDGDSAQEAIKSYQEVLTLTGDAVNGKQLFAVHCAACHQIGGKEGVFYGPDLATIRNRRPSSIMADILDPDLSIADGYDIWSIELKSGKTQQGLIGSETPSAITIRNYGGVETTIARDEIKSLNAMGTSVMTRGFDRIIDKQEMADLLAFLGQTQ